MELDGIVDRLMGKDREAWNQRICGTVVLVQKGVLDVGGSNASHDNGIHGDPGWGKRVAFQLVSATIGDPSHGGRGVVGNEAHLEELEVTLKSTAEADSVYQVNFDWNESQGIPGAITIKNLNHSEFFFKTLTLEGVPDNGTIVFIANSWIYPIKYYSHDRIFFTNDTYLLSKMPAPLVPYRQDELEILRGDDNHGPYKAHERVYRYDYYNDLGRENNARPILGGSQDYPYPRRCRTGRPPTTDQNIYIPRDERFGHLKMSDSLHMALKIIDFTPFEFDSFEDILGLYTLDTQKAMYSPQVIRKMPLPHVIKTNVFSKLQDDKYGWRTDEEFARQMLAGMNPVIIRRLTDFPPKSILDRNEYGHHDSKITAADIERNLDNMTVENALRTNRLFILDHHDHFIPFLDRINRLKGNFIYATRTLLFLKDDGALKPLAIELSLPHRDGQQHGAESTVHTPADTGVKGHIWQFAKAYVCVNDSAWHQFVSHWLNTHAVMEPFVIATNRQLSVVHPVHKLLSPHYRQTMNVNADARHTLIMAGGLFEVTQCPGKYGLEMSSAAYKNWNFTEQALPEDLVRRGVAVRDPSSPYGVRLLIKDYPYAVDGLVIWWAIEQWVKEYLEIYYPNDGELIRDKELQEWWKEVREVGHGDLKDQDWWPKMDTVPELARSCATIIWVASALHAAVNFGQYSYAGYMPNRPAFSRRPMPQPGSVEYAQLERGGRQADRVFIRTFTNQFINIVGASLMEILSKHTSDEVYLGQRKDPELWTSDARALEAFKRFGSRLKKIEDRIVKMNRDPALKNRTGPVEMPYMLLYPNTSDVEGRRGEGLTAMGIPNSISI